MASRSKWLKELSGCEEVIANEEVDKLGCTVNEFIFFDGNMSNNDEVDEDLEAEYTRLTKQLGLPADTYSLTRIKPKLPNSTKYGIRSGGTQHMKSNKFSIFSRGLQGAAIAIAAFATTAVSKASSWNDSTIDGIIEDGDNWYNESFNHHATTDRRLLTVLDLEPSLTIQNKKNKIHLSIEEAAYSGIFRTEKPGEMHLVKALQLFFENNDSGILTSPIVNLSIWREGRSFNVFDAQPRLDNLMPDESHGSVKLMLLQNLDGVIFVILEKSNVTNEHFVLHPVQIKAVVGIDHEEEKKLNKKLPERRPSGYNIQGNFRAIVRSSFHINHSKVPDALQGHGHLIIAIAALIYSRLINARKWTTPMLDLIFNQSHIFIVDLARALEKKFNNNFEVKIDDIFGDIFLGVYVAKVKVQVNVVPGQGKKGKTNIDSGIREYFKDNLLGVLEIKKIFYAVWRDEDKYYFLDPFSCDEEGYRVDSKDPETLARYENATGCLTMNSSMNEMIETILENTGNTDKDPFFIHGINVLYVKTVSSSDGESKETVVYRGKKINRRPVEPVKQEEIIPDDCLIKMEMTPKPRADFEKTKNADSQYPDLMKNAEEYIALKRQEERDNEEKEEEEEDDDDVDKIKILKSWKVVNSHRLILHASGSCIDNRFDGISQGRQGLSMALSAITFAKLKHPSKWSVDDLDQVIYFGDKAHGDIVDWICRGSPEIKDDEKNESDEEKDSEEEDEEEEDGGEENQDEEQDIKDVKYIKNIPNHIEISMLPKKLKISENMIKFKSKMSIIEGNADPMVNLGEALDQYFRKYNELILENKGLEYVIWKEDGNYMTLNPYGSDEEGWRDYSCPAGFVVTDTINELVDLFHGILEFNERNFKIHFIHLEAIGPNNKYRSPVVIDLDSAEVEKYQTIFLPLTDEDILALKPEVKESPEVDDENAEEEEEEEEEEDEEDEEEKEEEDEKNIKTAEEKEEEEEETGELLVDPLMEIEEQDNTDAPAQLNLFLLTANVNLLDEVIDHQAKEATEYERLKYNHPPPFVLPPSRVLKILLTAKKATKSIPSLVSAFSIDSKLAIKSTDTTVQPATIETIDENNIPVSKLIKLPTKKYLVSRISPIGFTPLRAINEKYIHDEKVDNEKSENCKRKKFNNKTMPFYYNEIPEFPTSVRIQPLIIPLGPIIRTPMAKKKIKDCGENKKRKCKLSNNDKDFNSKLEKIVCYTEDILFNMLFSIPSINFEDNERVTEPDGGNNELTIVEENKEEKTLSMSGMNKKSPREIESIPEIVGFSETPDGNAGIITGNMSLENRSIEEEYHLKACHYAAILSILTKTVKNIHELRGSQLDKLIILSRKYFDRTGLLRYKQVRYFRNIDLLNIRFNIIIRQMLYADPENFHADILSNKIDEYLSKNSTGLLVFGNATYAFWYANNKYYIFDSYSCDERGRASDVGNACLLEFCNIEDMIEKIEKHSGIDARKPYRIYNLCITHVEMIRQEDEKGKMKKYSEDEKESWHEGDEDENDEFNGEEKERNAGENQGLEEEEEEEDRSIESNIEDKLEMDSKSEVSLIESPSWLDEKKSKIKQNEFDLTKPGFVALENYNVSALEVLVIEDDITKPILSPFKLLKKETKIINGEYPRKKQFNRNFNERSIVYEPIDLCIMAWSCIHDPSTWSTRTIRGIYEASQDLAFDSLLAAEDSSVGDMIDGLFTEFEVGNYRFRAVSAPLHAGKLFASEGWNLAMSLKKVFDTTIYTGAIVICDKAHIGIMKKASRLYAWWGVAGKKNIRIIMSDDMEDFLKILIQEIDKNEEVEFQMRVITISYAKMLDPDCSDVAGLHEEMLPSSSLPQIHRKNDDVLGPYDLEALFRPILPGSRPVIVHGSVALDQWDVNREPNVKRCYFVALLSVMLKRDIIQSPMPSMIDKIIGLADDLYRQFQEPKFHTEHILRNVTIMKRIFELRDVASPLFVLKNNPETGEDDFYPTIKRELKKHFNKHNDGILHLSNCCYGFWYSQVTNSYYYVDPYRCNSRGRRSPRTGTACLKVFSTLCQMVQAISKNRLESTTGFFIHRLHVESINSMVNKTQHEDYMWIYLDYHWSYSHVPQIQSKQRKNIRKKVKKNSDICKKTNHDEDKKSEGLSWNNYVIEIPQLIYSLWGTVGSYDERFAERAGKNQAGICVAILAMQNLCHPSKWTAAILDSAVICGDSYYLESLKSASRREAGHTNSFNLQACFKIFPHIWRIEFLPRKCGTLYGGNGRFSLADILKLGLEESPNVLVKCSGVTIAVVKSEDGFYVVDPCWTGPPLFLRNHGAVYVLRCRNVSAVVYALVKIFNTNLRLEFHVTPIIFEYKQEVCRTSDSQGKSMQKKILIEPVGKGPGLVRGETGNIVPGFVAVGDEDVYSVWRKHVGLALERGEQLENPIIPSPIPCLSSERNRNLVVSTNWHKNFGHPGPKSADYPAGENPSASTSLLRIFDACDEYPKTIDFLNKKIAQSSTMKRATKRKLSPQILNSKPLDCLPPKKFILKQSKKEFKKQVKEMSDEVYKTYKHRLKNLQNEISDIKSEEDIEDSPETGE